MPAHVRPLISVRENEYFTDYSALVTEYCGRVGFDLTSDLQPPSDLYIQVRGGRGGLSRAASNRS